MRKIPTLFRRDHAALSVEAPPPGRQAHAVAADLIDTLLKIAAFGFHDSNRDELRQYALAARDALAAADDTEEPA